MSDESEPKKRSQAERIRLEQSIVQARGMLISLEKCLVHNAPIGADMGQALVMVALSLATQIAKHDAYLLAEEDAEKKSPASLDFIQEGLEKRPFKRR